MRALTRMGALGLVVSAFSVSAMLVFVGCSGAPTRPSDPVLGRAAPGLRLRGYGEARPPQVFNNGDPTSTVIHIRWTSWGGPRAVGDGVSTYVWPGTGVGNNPSIGGARIVAFHLGTCAGRPSYNAVEWFFPGYGQTFNPNQYRNTCSHTSVGSPPKPHPCAAVRITTTGRAAKEVEVVGMACALARRLIARSPAPRSLMPAREAVGFVEAGFRCGTLGGSPPLFDCQRDRQEFLYLNG